MRLKNIPLYTALACALIATAAQASDARFERFSYEGRTQEIAQPAAGEFRNPILSGYYPDPSITRVGEDYYLINSSFTHYPGLPVFHSRDLVSWKQIGNAIDRPGQFNFQGLRSSRGIFAPDISYSNGVFYIVTTCVDCGGNVVMTASNPAGPWSDPKPVKFGGIDPSIFWDTDGKAYMVNNGDPIEKPRYDGHRAIWVQEFDPKTLSMVGERTLIVNGGVDISAKPIWIEGPHLLKRGEYYYLIAAEGGTGDQHSEVVFRSSSVRGPFKPYEHNPILSQRSLDGKRANPVTSAGHAKFVQTQNGDWWATFLATRPYDADLYNIGRETFLLPVTWKDGWPMVLEAGKRIPFTAPKPKLPEQPRPELPMSGDIAYTDEFTGAALSTQWIGVRTPAAPFYKLEQGALALTAGGQLGDLKSTPSFIGRRQQHHIAKVSTTLSFQPQRDGDRAGLVAYQSDESYLFYGISRIAGKNVLALYTRAKASEDVLVASAPFEGDSVALSVQADGGKMAFSYTAGGKTETLADKVDTTFLSTRKAGGFVGTIIGPYTWRAKAN
ncbi:glycoside hydrolase family 43 protein [Pseudoduganella aquatica]|uniref:glycoside hydrolase family 43 protein n=1 Tax=Pseudoduganella aquatica TaxID=2660641 RepID=UPI001E6327B8|nr:glycoside hydrolase family 43 protein [Pseudoduganella aquatica]